MSNIKLSTKKAAKANLTDFCEFTNSERKHSGDYIEVTECINEDSYDIIIKDNSGKRLLTLSHAQFKAIYECIEKIKHNSI